MNESVKLKNSFICVLFSVECKFSFVIRTRNKPVNWQLESSSEIKKKYCIWCFYSCYCFQLSTKTDIQTYFGTFDCIFTANKCNMYQQSWDTRFFFICLCVYFVYHAARYLFMIRAFRTCSVLVIFWINNRINCQNMQIFNATISHQLTKST